MVAPFCTPSLRCRRIDELDYFEPHPPALSRRLERMQDLTRLAGV
jgi:hypothetical protein